MPSQERIGALAKDGGGLRFVGLSQQTSNVKGNISFNKVVWYDDFEGKTIDSTNDYTVAAVGDGAAAIGVPNECTLTTSTVDDDDIELAMGIEWYGQYNATMEIKFSIDDVDKSGVNIGFANTTGYSADALGMMYSGTTLSSEATEFAGVMHDADATTSNLYFISSKAGADGSVIDTSATPADTDDFVVRIELVDNGATCDAKFYLNSSGNAIDPDTDYVGEELDAVTRTTALCPYIGLINHGESAANTLRIDYIKLWEYRR